MTDYIAPCPADCTCSRHRRESDASLAVTRRAEEIREETGCSWERACLQAEADRDETVRELERQSNEDTAADHGFDVCPDCGNGGIKIGSTGYVDCTRFLTCWADVDDETGDVNPRD